MDKKTQDQPLANEEKTQAPASPLLFLSGMCVTKANLQRPSLMKPPGIPAEILAKGR